MTITIHLGSLLGGLALGFLFGSLMFTFISLDDRWHVGFSEGVKAGRELEKGKRGEQNE